MQQNWGKLMLFIQFMNLLSQFNLMYTLSLRIVSLCTSAHCTIQTLPLPKPKNIFFKVVHPHPIAKFDRATHFCPSRCKIVITPLTFFRRSDGRSSCSPSIHVLVMSCGVVGGGIVFVRINFYMCAIFYRPQAQSPM